MAIINLRRYYPRYLKDKFIEAPDEVAAAELMLLEAVFTSVKGRGKTGA